MPISAWIMLLFGCVVLYGGLGYCLNIAIKNGRNKK
ncbi:MAG: MetS family NSS transporter small subunit [Clostridia bacterium]|nr:MetS family NSS transporter small subunit [Clostridia bacterium]